MNEQLYSLKEEMFLQDLKEAMKKHGFDFAVISFGAGDDNRNGYISSHVLSSGLDDEFDDGLIKIGYQMGKKIFQLNNKLKSKP